MAARLLLLKLEAVGSGSLAHKIASAYAGIVVCAIAIAVAFANAPASLVLCGLTSTHHLFPDRKPRTC